MVHAPLDRPGRLRLALVAAVGLAGGALVGATFSGPEVVRVTVPVGALLCAVAAVLGQLAEWRRVGGRAWSLALRRAIRSGAVPADADPREWVPRLEQAVRDLGGERWRYLVFALPWLLGLGSGGSHDPAWWIVAVGGLAVALVGSVRAWIRHPRVRRRVRSMLVPLEARWAAELRPA